MTNQDVKKEELKIRKAVREHYANAVIKETGCCGGNTDQKTSGCGCGTTTKAEVNHSKQLYQTEEIDSIPEEVANLSLGCGDPITLASLKEGQTVLDLGSGGGLDCFMAGKKVGPTGHVIGVDMTPEMLDQARANILKVKSENVEFRLGEIEHLPVSDNTVDVVISNCVINLSTDKPLVFSEIFRVLKPGGRLAVSDIVTGGDLSEEVRTGMKDWAGCIAGAMDMNEMIAVMTKIGYTNISITPVAFGEEFVDGAIRMRKVTEKLDLKEMAKHIFSASISAEKPQSN